MDENSAKNCHIYAPISKNHFKVKMKMSLTERSAWTKNFSRLEKVVYTAISLTFTSRSKRRLNK